MLPKAKVSMRGANTAFTGNPTVLTRQTDSGVLLNNFISGTIGGLVGTLILFNFQIIP